jgi:thiamine-monophosphate kinase
VTSEFAFIEALRAVATDPAARGLADDAAVIEIGGERLVLTMDTIVESVHCLPGDPAADVAWKLVAVNVSDLSAKGAEPVGCLVSYALGDDEWDSRFLEGLKEAATHFAIPLLGGDTVRMPQGAPRSFSLTAIGRAPTGGAIPSRAGARPGDNLWVSGTIGDAGAGLAILSGRRDTAPSLRAAADWLVGRYRRPSPLAGLGIALAPHVTAMMDISDGLLIDSRRIADASGVSLRVSAEAVPLSAAFRALCGQDPDARMAAMTSGDDYCLLFTAPPEHTALIRETAAALSGEVSVIGGVESGTGISLLIDGKPAPLPGILGYQH